MGKYKSHKAKWIDCEECPLCEKRKNVVLARGVIPCDVLFVGEAPGPNEDVLGKPFVGPAGFLLDSQIESALEEAGLSPQKVRIAFTNLIACIPKSEETNVKFTEPPRKSITACAPRLAEFIEIADPLIIVRVGKYASKWVSHDYTADIVHPAAILRADKWQQGLANQKSIVTLRDVFIRTTQHKLGKVK